MSLQLYGSPSRNTGESGASRHDRIAVHADLLRGVAQSTRSFAIEQFLAGGCGFGPAQIRGTMSTWSGR